MQGIRGTRSEKKAQGGNGKAIERGGYGKWKANESKGINGERYDECYYGIGREEKEEEYRRTGFSRYRQKKISRYQTRMAQQMAKYGTDVQEFMKGEKAGKSWEDIFENESRSRKIED